MKQGEDIKIAHVRTNDNAIQSLEDHSENVGEMASRFAKDFGMSDIAKIIGILHDKGKERKSFQNYIRKISGLDETSSWYGEDKQHAYIGAKIASTIYANENGLLGYPIMGHHSGLDDYTNFENKMEGVLPSEVSPVKNILPFVIPKEMLSKIKDKDTLKRDLHHIIRMLFSCLVDADFLDTETFMDEVNSRLRQIKSTLGELAQKLDSYLLNLSENASKSALNDLRQKIQNRCKELGESETGVFSLTVPTGGGKTLSSLVWAFKHAMTHRKKRIIIAIPYTSIVTQTAQILGNIFGQENVLEHHSNFDEQHIKDSELRRRMRLATENWDYPIIVTTNVQLLESMLSNKPSGCRKLHNIANSILIMDEVQTLPIGHLQPIIDTLETYHRLFNVSILFTTASLPALRGDICWGRSQNCKLRGIENIQEIIPDEWKLHDKLRRTQLKIDLEPVTAESLSERLAKHDKVLCIVNTRREAKAVYDLLPDEVVKIHLSRMMCSAHLRKTIVDIKEYLKKGAAIRVIATQLIEAGVDIDFPVVYRQEAGLDSVLQAAGRCNREGKREISDVFVFRLEKKPFGYIGRSSDAWQCMDEWQNRNVDWFAPDTMSSYFIQRYSRQDSFDKADLTTLLYKPKEWMFETAAKDFQMIDDKGNFNVIVNYEESPLLIEKLKSEGPSYSLMKRLSQYSVNIRKNDFEELLKYGIITEIVEGLYYIPDREQYREDVGLVTKSHWLEEILIK